jgi:hypothetical protein
MAYVVVAKWTAKAEEEEEDAAGHAAHGASPYWEGER